MDPVTGSSARNVFSSLAARRANPRGAVTFGVLCTATGCPAAGDGKARLTVGAPMKVVALPPGTALHCPVSAPAQRSPRRTPSPRTMGWAARPRVVSVLLCAVGLLSAVGLVRVWRWLRLRHRAWLLHSLGLILHSV